MAIQFKMIKVGDTVYNRFSFECPLCHQRGEVSGDERTDAERAGVLSLACCGKTIPLEKSGQIKTIDADSPVG